MRTTASLALLGLLRGTVVAHPSANRLYVRDCEPGALVCQGEDQYGLCNLDKSAVFMMVSEGTKCVCSGSDCTIAAVEGDGAPVSRPLQDNPTPAPRPASQAAPTPEPTSQTAPLQEAPSRPAPRPSSQTAAPASEPSATSAQSAPSTQSAASRNSSPGGVFKEIPTVTFSAAPSQTSTPKSGSGADSGSSSPSGGINIGTGMAYIKTFLGNGAASSGWPAEDKWASFDSMWKANEDNVISKSCSTFGQANNSPSENADLKSAIQNVAQSSGVDERFILAVVMQESGGCVRAPTTNYGVTNPGVMQSHNGANSCQNVNPCPMDTIEGMIRDGTEGTADGDGLKQLLAKAGGDGGVEQYYKAARMYNSGSVAATGQLQDGIATKCYASDIANRLIGWSEGIGTCKLG